MAPCECKCCSGSCNSCSCANCKVCYTSSNTKFHLSHERIVVVWMWNDTDRLL
ncbi:hypothetical protein ASPFODRAFT_52983 [Aspergillus luchuensis CBS 106.47]|uniref:Metallothionein n=1 Tax=Aspergillus luchuensis (strain CBS 106.47) TaxID=1137211 RepID=A0A1M3T209_ASPLC|nr:hypothetical protein ASPFODRAFT_52983 [Aspergillus luchuensis CBS 106.47]